MLSPEDIRTQDALRRMLVEGAISCNANLAVFFHIIKLPSCFTDEKCTKFARDAIGVTLIENGSQFRLAQLAFADRFTKKAAATAATRLLFRIGTNAHPGLWRWSWGANWHDTQNSEHPMV